MSNITMFPSSGEFETMERIAKMGVHSGLLPSSIKNISQAGIIMIKGREIGMPPMQAFSHIHVINGRPTISAEGMLSLVYRAMPNATVKFEKSDETICVIKAARPGQEPDTFSFSIEDAKVAGLLGKGPWKQYPSAMLRARAIAIACRAKFPDAISGMSYTPEELGAEIDVDDLGNEVVEVKEVVEPEKVIEKKELPKSEVSGLPNHAPNVVGPKVEIDPGDFVLGFGRYVNKRLRDIPMKVLVPYFEAAKKSLSDPSSKPNRMEKDFLIFAEEWIKKTGETK